MRFKTEMRSLALSTAVVKSRARIRRSFKDFDFKETVLNKNCKLSTLIERFNLRSFSTTKDMKDIVSEKSVMYLNFAQRYDYH